MSITEITGYDIVRKLYVQLLYKCNFSCKHCFHGERLKSQKRLTLTELQHLLVHFQTEYKTRHVILLGGEPFLHPEFTRMVNWCAENDWFTETCTNGHRFVHRILPNVASSLDLLRVSIDGLQPAHDAMRQQGSFDHALRTLDIARSLDITTGVTLVVTADNVDDVPLLADVVSQHGAVELKLHQLRRVGNARTAPDLKEADLQQLSRLTTWIKSAEHPLRVVFDDDLDPFKLSMEGPPPASGELGRIELDPDGGLTMSCKAVGTNRQAFYWSAELNRVIYKPSTINEVCRYVPDVNYV